MSFFGVDTLLDANVLVPQLGALFDKGLHERSALGVVKHHYLDSTLLEVRFAAEKGPVLANHDAGNAVKDASASALSCLEMHHTGRKFEKR